MINPAIRPSNAAAGSRRGMAPSPEGLPPIPYFRMHPPMRLAGSFAQGDGDSICRQSPGQHEKPSSIDIRSCRFRKSQGRAAHHGTGKTGSRPVGSRLHQQGNRRRTEHIASNGRESFREPEAQVARAQHGVPHSRFVAGEGARMLTSIILAAVASMIRLRKKRSKKLQGCKLA